MRLSTILSVSWEALLFLSKFEVNPARRDARRLLSSPQAMHAAVEASFPSSDSPSGQMSRVLWRVDKGEHRPTLYVVSPEAPDFTHLVEQAGWPTQPRWGSVDYSSFLESLAAGQQWQFRLTANPVHHERQPNGGRGKRYAHVTVRQQAWWLARRAASLGFAVTRPASDDGEVATGMDSLEEFDLDAVDFAVTDRQDASFKRRSRTVTIRRVQFDGVLAVTDADQFRSTLTRGVGPAKAYGCGLLTLAPLTAAAPEEKGR